VIAEQSRMENDERDIVVAIYPRARIKSATNTSHLIKIEGNEQLAHGF
jgi:hypothetical protein